MAPSHRWYFADQHMLMRTQYSGTATHVCDMCWSKLAGLVGYRCNTCDFDVHEACADYFKKTLSFFAHPWHALELSRIPTGRIGWSWQCDLCGEECPAGSLAYRCAQCGFDAHPLCTMLPQVVRSHLHREHELRMVPGTGGCSACREALPVWHYRCGFCAFKLHVACVAGAPGAGAGAGNQGVVARPSRGNRVAKFLLKQSFKIAIDVATGGMASAVIGVLTNE